MQATAEISCTYLSAWPQERMKNRLSFVVDEESIRRSPSVPSQDIFNFIQRHVDTNYSNSPKENREIVAQKE